MRGTKGEGAFMKGRRTAAACTLALRAELPVERYNSEISLLTGMCAASIMLAGGIGILRIDPIEAAPLALLIDLVPSAEVERFPEARYEDILGLSIPLIALAPFEASAAAKVRFAYRAFPTGRLPVILG